MEQKFYICKHCGNEVCFALCEGGHVEAVYAYCNRHSLGKA